ncbi:hypothetical protein ACLH6Q_000685 [Campylobacter fetus]|uniref:hypothetical protein n=1 Tax=Campylobacter fetus TaxID=196 RepID=UPI00112F7FD0|nr:hypothetical protein [Campylobacter fetus]EAH8300439.1 hypothetical protein [Campylobacter fetus]EAI7232858.1 hypothetical protein [Campylobacter fetus]EAJ5690370.1 hypothetical protein [Campylobacter fetus]EAK0428091.1 hypothetical protein [Campylobacter fetus]EAK5304676.1 hypothetical protein [Campylobacter fetus]
MSISKPSIFPVCLFKSPKPGTSSFTPAVKIPFDFIFSKFEFASLESLLVFELHAANTSPVPKISKPFTNLFISFSLY